MSEEWTPGEWRVEADMRAVYLGQDRYSDNEEYLAGWNVMTDDGEVVGIEGITPGGPAEANARLIAAAPDLAEAAIDALAGWRYIRQQHGDLAGVGWDRVERALMAALAKARGEHA